ncbi:GLB3-like protein [Mya arenaria]|uniref:GLB3-like protein n=1 Tax=Mya arenaria TaxID=6604 RepID=A0ABY7G4L1_MYAAR|nr:hemoglobin-3-like [Mya arenaria]XP_052779125.1 hemoglobin-3-like [Mya arenaria]XP_052779127.1 hemoglobin-3-like [Mya arenaria]XP_052779128.1 hemoglobin-3-like [Mya arenaria]WAR26231.1 GLB3-like protein [Mya arenaria]
MGDIVDPGTGLTERQKTAVRESWAKMGKDNIVEFYFRLFTTFPHIRAYFKTLDGLDQDALKISPKLRAHAINFRHGVSSFIDNLDDIECLVILIQKVTENHFRRNIKPKPFEEAFSLFTTFVGDVQEVDEFTLNAWKATLATVLSVITEHMKTLEEQTDGH